MYHHPTKHWRAAWGFWGARFGSAAVSAANVTAVTKSAPVLHAAAFRGYSSLDRKLDGFETVSWRASECACRACSVVKLVVCA